MTIVVRTTRADSVADRLADALPTVARHETHGSWVVLTADRAYKIKKPVVLPFLDYGTLARRREMCRAEVALNRRSAPRIYLGVRAIVPDGDGVALADEDAPGALEYAGGSSVGSFVDADPRSVVSRSGVRDDQDGQVGVVDEP